MNLWKMGTRRTETRNDVEDGISPLTYIGGN